MPANKIKYAEIKNELAERNIDLVAVSKIRSADEILELFNDGQKDFGENYVQELLDKQLQLPAEIRWHFIGHLQSNKVKSIIPFVNLIHVNSLNNSRIVCNTVHNAME